MALDPTKVKTSPGFFWWGVANTTPPDFGGDCLGYSKRGILFKDTVYTQRLEYEESGKELRDLIYLGDDLEFEVELMQWDATTIAAAFTNTEAGPVNTSEKMAVLPGRTIQAGQKMGSVVGNKLLFVPRDTTNYYWYFPVAIPMINGPIPAKSSEIKTLNIKFACIRDDSQTGNDLPEFSARLFAGPLSDFQSRGL